MAVPATILWVLVMWALPAAAISVAAQAADARPELVLTVVPRQPPAVTHVQWMPFSKRLGDDIGARIMLRVFDSIIDFERSFQAGEPDLVYLNPYHAVIARRAQGYIPLARAGAGGLSGALVVARDGPIHTLQDLQDKTIAFPHPNAFGASLYMRALLTERHRIRFTANYVTSHGNVYRHVLRGLAAAGGGVNVTLRQEPPAVQEGLRVLYETPPVAPHPLSVHPRVPAALRAAIARAVLAMADDEPGRGMLAAVNLHDPVAADYARDYRDLERLQLEKYYVPTAAP